MGVSFGDKKVPIPDAFTLSKFEGHFYGKMRTQGWKKAHP